MKPTAELNELGQSLWLDNITRKLLASGTLQRYIDELSVTGRASNPTIFNRAIKGSADYDDDIRAQLKLGQSGEALFFELALADIAQAADLFLPIHQRTRGAAERVHQDPGTAEGLPAIEEAIFAGVPVNVTLLFSSAQYLAAAGAFLRGIERRIDAGLSPFVALVASLFVSRWDVAVAGKVPPALDMQLGVAVGRQVYKAYCDIVASPRYRRVMNEGAPVQRLLLASTGTKNPKASDTLYVEALAAPFTVDTMPEATLNAFADHGKVGAATPADGGDCEAVLAQFRRAGIDLDDLAARLQTEGAASFVASWNELMGVIASKSAALASAA